MDVAKICCNLNDWSATTVLDMGINFAQLKVYMDNSLPKFRMSFVCLKVYMDNSLPKFRM